MSLKRDLLFVRENTIPIHHIDFMKMKSIDNIIINTDEAEYKWIEVSTKQVGLWRDTIKSCYIRWALSINGLHVAQAKYNDPVWQSTHKFTVGSLVMRKDLVEPSNMVVWDGPTAATAHFETVQMLASYGLIDLYSIIEEMLLWFYRTFKEYNPQQFITGKENKVLRVLFNKRETDPDAWNTEWQSRLDKWQRKKIYDGIAKILLGYYATAGLKNPSGYKQTNPETWADTLTAISILRNCLIHGTKQVPKELADLSGRPYAFEATFKEGEDIKLDTFHLMSVELFAEQLLSAINTSLFEFYVNHQKSNPKESA